MAAAVFPEHCFVLAGQGPHTPRACGLPSVVTNQGLGRADFARLYHAADFFVFDEPGRRLSALASGLPLLCSTEIVAADPGIARFAATVDAEQVAGAAKFVDLLQPLWTAGGGLAGGNVRTSSDFPVRRRLFSNS